MYRLTKERLFESLTKIEISIYENSIAGKTTRKPFEKGNIAEFPVQLIHSDCGPMSEGTRHRASYFIIFIDDYTLYSHFYFISHKPKTLECFIQLMNLAKNQLNLKIKALRTNRRYEYLSDQFKDSCDEKEILRQLTI